MEMNFNYNILDANRRSVLPQLAFLKENFYLAGGTALALQIGHRRSIDFDFFTQIPFNNMRMFIEYEEKFKSNVIEKTQDSKDTLTILIDNDIKISMFKIPYPTIYPLIEDKNISVLPMLEVGAMKLIALTRAAFRDYVDMYFILHHFSLNDIFRVAKKKYKNFDEGIYLKCLLSFDDIEMSPIQFINDFERSETEIFSFIEIQTKEYIKRHT
jgi:hypothetical protein